MLTEPPPGIRPPNAVPQVLARGPAPLAEQGAPLWLPADGSVVVMPDMVDPDQGRLDLVALLALWLAREGVPVLVHRPGAPGTRGGAAEVLASLGIAPAHDAADVADRWARREPAVVSSDQLRWPSAGVAAGWTWAIPWGQRHPLCVVPCPTSDDGAAAAAWAEREGAALLRLAGPWPFDARHCPGTDVWIGGRHRPELGAQPFDEPPGRGTPLPRLATPAAMAVFVQDVLSGERPMPGPWQQLALCVARARDAGSAPLAQHGLSCL